MGYTSILNSGPAFRAKIGITEVLKSWEKFKADKKGVNQVHVLDLYSFIPTYEARDDIIEIWMDDWDAKHYDDDILAEFISTIIHPASYTYLTFDGEDGSKWGYWITSGQVRFLESVWVLEETKATLDDKIETWEKAHEKQVIKKSRRRVQE